MRISYAALVEQLIEELDTRINEMCDTEAEYGEAAELIASHFDMVADAAIEGLLRVSPKPRADVFVREEK